MRFLIDECLHPTLALVARTRGFEAHHLNFLGLASTSDHALMTRIIDGDFVFVTNNADDFRRLYRRHPLHAGLVLIVPQVAPAAQRAIFETVLDVIDPQDGLLNEILEIRLDDEGVVFNRYAWPAPGP